MGAPIIKEIYDARRNARVLFDYVNYSLLFLVDFAHRQIAFDGGGSVISAHF